MDAHTFRFPRPDAPLRELTDYLARAAWLATTARTLLAHPPADWPVGSKDPVAFRHFITRLAEAMTATELPEHLRSDLTARNAATELVNPLGRIAGGAWLRPFVDSVRAAELVDRLRLQTTLQLAATERFSPGVDVVAYMIYRSYQMQSLSDPPNPGYWVAVLAEKGETLTEVEGGDVREVLDAYLSLCDRARGMVGGKAVYAHAG